MADPITSMATKRAAMAAWLLDVLGGFDSRYKVDEHVRPVVLDGSSPEVRAKIMGAPVRYAWVLYNGLSFPEDEGMLRATIQTERIDSFLVQVWFELVDADNLADTSHRVWDEIVGGVNGVPTLLAALQWLEDARSSVDIPRDIETMLWSLDDQRQARGPSLAHFLSFTINLRS